MDFGSLIEGTGLLIFLGFVAVAVIVAIVVAIIFIRSWVKVARADEALVISGKPQKSKDGSDTSVTVIVNGKAIVSPLTQRYETISLRSRQVNMTAEAQSFDGVTLNVEAVAIVKIGSNRDLVRRAAERFASQDKAIEEFTTEQLEGALRGVVATLEVVTLMRDRKKFSEQIANDVSGELEDQGLILDSFQIKGITDNSEYIKSLGAPEIEAKRQDAEIARTNSERAIRKQQITNEESNLIEQTEFDKNSASSKSEVGRANAQAEQAEALASAQSEQAVLQQKAENKQATLDADVKRVADAKLYEQQKSADAEAYRRVKDAEANAQIAQKEAESTRVRAEAEAKAIELEGEAKAKAIQAEANAIAENQEALLAQRAIETLPELMQSFSKNYEKIGNVTIVGGSSTTAGDTIANENSVAMRGLFDSVKATTGLDMTSIIQGRSFGRALGEGINDSKENEDLKFTDASSAELDDFDEDVANPQN